MLDEISGALLVLCLQLTGELSAEDWALLDAYPMRGHHSQCSKCQLLHCSAPLSPHVDNQEDGDHLEQRTFRRRCVLALGKGLSYAVLPIEDVMDAEKAIVSLPEDAAKEVLQETSDSEGVQQAQVQPIRR